MGTMVIHCEWLLTMAEGQEPIHDADRKSVV